MSPHRRSLRRAAATALASLLFSASGFTPAGVHARAAADADFHADFCTSIAADATAASPLSGDRDDAPKSHAHCDECTGCAGSAIALAPAGNAWSADAPTAERFLPGPSPAPSRRGDLVARPRGPPAPR